MLIQFGDDPSQDGFLFKMGDVDATRPLFRLPLPTNRTAFSRVTFLVAELQALETTDTREDGIPTITLSPCASGSTR